MMFSVSDWIKRKCVNAVCDGYSGRAQWDFFKVVLSKPRIKNICVLGVYKGRDIVYMSAILKNLDRNEFSLTGVDKFENRYCDDWPQELRNKTWQEAGFGNPPELDTARENLRKLNVSSNIHLVQDFAGHFLANTRDSFDLIYIDTAHDYESTLKIIELAIPKLNPNGFVGGDDFSDQGTWGVESAVKDSFAHFQVFSNWLWLARDCAFNRKLSPTA